MVFNIPPPQKCIVEKSGECIRQILGFIRSRPSCEVLVTHDFRYDHANDRLIGRLTLESE